MIRYVRYRKSTGVIAQTGMYPEQSIHLLEDDIHGVIIGLAQDDKHYVKDMQILEYPEKPSDDFEWDGNKWVGIKSDEELKEDSFNRLRGRRNELIAKSDWTQMPDSPLTDTQKTAWADYRQALRDLPQNVGEITSLADVVWPIPPN